MWSRPCSNWGVLIGLGLLEAACSTSHVARKADAAAPAQVAAAPVTPTSAAAPASASGTVTAGAGAGAGAGTAAPAQVVAVVPAVPPPPRATADFAHAVALVRSGKDEEAELEFQLIATAYPAYPGALVNLGILYRKHGDLARSDQSLHAAVQRAAGNAEAWNELGVTLRLEGKFHEAADAYNQAISVNQSFAPAYRNLAIVLDLYLGDTAAALTAMEHYRDLGADDKAVTGWIADLKQRAGKNAVAPGPTPASPAAPPGPDKAGD